MRGPSLRPNGPSGNTAVVPENSILWFPKIPSGRVRAVRQNQRMIRYDACDRPPPRNVCCQSVQVAAPTLKPRTSFFVISSIFALRRRPPRLRLRGSDRALLVWMTHVWPSLFGLVRVVEPAERHFVVRGSEAQSRRLLCGERHQPRWPVFRRLESRSSFQRGGRPQGMMRRPTASFHPAVLASDREGEQQPGQSLNARAARGVPLQREGPPSGNGDGGPTIEQKLLALAGVGPWRPGRRVNARDGIGFRLCHCDPFSPLAR
jgi:hypothetical protein